MPPPPRKATIAAVHDLYRENYYSSDPDALDLVLGVVAGTGFGGDPAWVLLVSPPSAGKTELLTLVDGCPETVFVSDVSSNALISGYKDDVRPGKGDAAGLPPDPPKDHSLLPALDGKTVVTKDFSVVYDKPAEVRAQVMAALRDAFDGSSSKAFGNGGLKSYRSRFNYLAGMTPDVEKAWSLNTLGDRFLLYRLHVADRREHARRALRLAANPTNVKSSLQALVRRFLAALPRAPVPALDAATSELTIDLADVLAIGRTYVHREKNDDVSHLPQAEFAARIARQLARIGAGVALVRGRPEVTPDEFRVMRRVALDSLPAVRRRLLAALWGFRDGPRPLADFSAAVPLVSAKTVERELENLSFLGAVARTDQAVAERSDKLKADGTQKTVRTVRKCYRLADDFRGCCERAGGVD